MSTEPEVYNYANYSWAIEDGAYDQWLAEAPALGSQAPDFTLADLDGGMHTLAAFRGRPVVIEFGSYTCPIFCGQIPAMEELARRHRESTFLIIYTREAHPGEVTPAHETEFDKRAAASLLTEEEAIARTMLVDDVRGTVHQAFGAVWDSVFVLDSDGRVVLRRAWNDPAQVDAVLSTLAAGDELQPIESIEMAGVAGPGGFGHGLLRGGEQALLDFYDTAPPPVRERLQESQSDEVREILAAQRP